LCSECVGTTGIAAALGANIDTTTQLADHQAADDRTERIRERYFYNEFDQVFNSELVC
jgi:hypothetical protein